MFLPNKKLHLLLFFSTIYTITAQQTFKAPEAPRTFEYTKYDQIPTGEYTGIPNISIPLYTMQSDNVKIPLTLQYHAGGIRVSEEASYVGLGWNLNFGIITQTINGKDDLVSSPFRKKQKLIYRNSPLVNQWPIVCSIINGPGVYCVPDGVVENYFSDINAKPLAGDFNSMFISTGPVLPKTGIASSIVNNPYGEKEFIENFDYEPDIFRVNFFGHSIKFMQNFDSNYDEIIVLDNKGYKVTKVAIGNGKFDWNITTPDGAQYIFSNYKKESSNSAGSNLEPEGNYDNSGFSGASYTNKWFLTKIITSKNKIITINYTDYGIADAKSYDQKFRKIKVNSQYFAQSIAGIYKGIGVYNTPELSEMTQTTYNSISESVLYPSSIENDETKIYFSYSSRTDRKNDKKLDKITIKNNTNIIIKEYNFSYDYFISAITGNVIRLSDNIFSPTTRLKLVALKEAGSNPYQFIYSSAILPQKNSTAQDFWGFYNGKTTNLSIAPNPVQLGLTGLGNNGNDNAANINFSTASSLKEIVYPTKGKISYEYELQEYTRDTYDTALPNADGIISSVTRGYGNRVKSITLSHNGNFTKKTNFSYTGGKSIVPFNLYYSYNINTGYLGGGDHVNPFVLQSLAISDFAGSNYFRPSLFSNINTVGYDTVIVEEIAGTVGNGKTVLQFHNNKALPPSPVKDYQNYLTLPARENINLVSNGQKISESIYNNKNFKVKEITNNYIINKSNIYYGTKISAFRSLYSVLQFNGTTTLLTAAQYLVGYYLIYDKHCLLSSQTTTDYFTSGTISNKVEYDYNDYNQIISNIKSNTLSGEFYKEVTTYSITPSSIVQKNILNLPATKTIFTNGTKKEQINILYDEISNIIIPKKVTKFPLGNPSPSKTKSVFYDTYDTFGNLVEFHSQDGIYTVVIWGYSKTLPIAKIENATYTQVANALGTTTTNLNTYNETNLAAIDNLRNSSVLSNAMITTYTHKPLVGITTIKDEKADTITYTYDNYGKLISVKDALGNLISENQYHYKN